MATVAELLRRFRFSGVPGAPVSAGVPSNRLDQVHAELAGVLASLQGIVGAADQVRAAAEQGAERKRSEGAAEAKAILAEASSLAAAAMKDAEGLVRSKAMVESAALVEQARAEADRIDNEASTRLAAVAVEIADRILGRLGPR
ncbi:MAG: hypothetical protein ACYCTL_12130 [Acidimicrobiales bacterium]